MPPTYTSNNKIKKIANGEESGTWGTTTNTNFDLYDTAIDGVLAVTLSGSTGTLNIPDGASGDGRNKIIIFSGSLSGANTVSITPNTVKKHYFVQNNTTGGQNVVISQGSGSTVTVKPGYSSVVYADGAGSGASVKEVLTGLKLTSVIEATGAVLVGSSSGSTTISASSVASGTITIPAATDTLVGKATTDILTNKTISGSNNTLTNIGNSSLTNSSVTINGTSVALGASASVTSNTTNSLSAGTGLSGGPFDGSAPITLSIDSTVATLAGSQSLSNKTLASPVITGTVTAGGGVGSSGQYLQSTGTGVQWATVAGSGGTVTSITAGTGLTGGTITTSGTIAIDSTVVTASNTQTLTNKTFDTAGSGNVFRVNGTQINSSTGSGSVVLDTSPTITTPTAIGASGNAAYIATGQYSKSVGNSSSIISAKSNDSGNHLTLKVSLDGNATAASRGSSLQCEEVGATYRNFSLQPLGGNVGIGLTPGNINYLLHLNSDSAAKPSTNTWTIVSDSRIKDVTGEYSKGLSEVCQIRPVKYRYNGKGGMPVDGKEHVSIIAQELSLVFPECIGSYRGKLDPSDEQETDIYNFNGHAITFALINAIKELKAEIDAMKALK